MDALSLIGFVQALKSECNVFCHCEVREQSVILEDHAHAAFFGGFRQALPADHAIRQFNLASIQFFQASNGSQ